jgi:virulence activator alpha
MLCQELLAEYADHTGRSLTARFAINRAEADLAWIDEARAALT